MRTNEKQKRHEWRTDFKSTFTTGFIKRFSEILCSQTICAFLSQYSRAFRDRLPQFETCWDRVPLIAYAVRIASMILRTAGFLCVLYTEICVNATLANYSLCRYWIELISCFTLLSVGGPHQTFARLTWPSWFSWWGLWVTCRFRGNAVTSILGQRLPHKMTFQVQFSELFFTLVKRQDVAKKLNN